MPHVIFKEKLDAKLEQLLQVNLKKLPKRIRGSIRRSPTQIIRSEDVEEEEEDGEEEEEDVEEEEECDKEEDEDEEVDDDELERRIQQKLVPTWDPQDMWDALYREEQEYEAMVARRNLIKIEKLN